jgi:hypothetical protein
MMKKIIVAIAVIFGVFLAIGCVGNDAGKTTTAVETQTEPATTPVADPEPVIIANFTGSSTKDTENFHVSSNQWKIVWSTTQDSEYKGTFAFFVYNADGSSKYISSMVSGTNSDNTVIRGSGDYYMKIITSQPYNVTIYAV